MGKVSEHVLALVMVKRDLRQGQREALDGVGGFFPLLIEDAKKIVFSFFRLY